MSPAIRDLKGRPVDEIVTSRDGSSVPDAGPQMVERAAVRQAVEKVQAKKPPPLDIVEDRANPERDEAREHVAAALKRQPVPADITSCLQDVDASMALLYGQCQHVMTALDVLREQILALKARVEKDAVKLARVNDLLKAIE